MSDHDRAGRAKPRSSRDDKTCALCGHRGFMGASVDENDLCMHLCHEDDHSCYHRWTVYGDRPNGEVDLCRWQPDDMRPEAHRANR